MGYSLSAIRYLVELQTKEMQQAYSMHHIEKYSFCDEIGYRETVSEYLITHNNNALIKMLNNHRDICNAIVKKWENELQFMGAKKEEELNYAIYCILDKNTDFPFANLDITRGKRSIDSKKENHEFWKYLMERNRKWTGINDATLFQKDYFNSKEVSTSQLVEFAKKIKSFLDEHVSKNDVSQIQQPSQSTITDNPIRQFTDEQIDLLKIYFVSTFKGAGKNINYFEMFIEGLKIDRTPKEFAQIAALCYYGEQMNNKKPNTFKRWYKIFCECVGCEIKSYTPNKLKNPKEQIKKLFNYL